MAVDPAFQTVLDVVNAMPETDFSRPPLELAGEMRAAPVRIPPLPHPVAVEVRAIAARNGHGVPVRIYRPDSPSPHAVLISLHGGGWVRGSLDGDEFRSHLMAHESGCAVISVDYRLAPEHPFPAALEDCLAVFAWAADNAASAGFDSERMGLAGDSAGANLAAATAICLRDAGALTPKCQILTYPVCDHDFTRASYEAFAKGLLLTRPFMMWCWDQYAAGANRDDPRLSPLRCGDLSGLPPALVFTAEFDPLRDEGEAFAAALSAAGNLLESRRIEGAIHAFQSVLPNHSLTLETLREAARFAARQLRGG